MLCGATVLDDPNELKLAQVMGATAEMLSSIVRLLELRGFVGTDVAGSPFPRGFPRYDILMLRETARILRRKRRTGGWRPVVVQGGLSEPRAIDEGSDHPSG